MTDINVSLEPVNFTVSTDLEGACFYLFIRQD